MQAPVPSIVAAPPVANGQLIVVVLVIEGTKLSVLRAAHAPKF